MKSSTREPEESPRGAMASTVLSPAACAIWTAVWGLMVAAALFAGAVSQQVPRAVGPVLIREVGSPQVGSMTIVSLILALRQLHLRGGLWRAAVVFATSEFTAALLGSLVSEPWLRGMSGPQILAAAVVLLVKSALVFCYTSDYFRMCIGSQGRECAPTHGERRAVGQNGGRQS